MSIIHSVNAPFQVFGIQVSLSQLHSDATDPPVLSIIPPFSVAGSNRNCILPGTWYVCCRLPV